MLNKEMPAHLQYKTLKFAHLPASFKKEQTKKFCLIDAEIGKYFINPIKPGLFEICHTREGGGEIHPHRITPLFEG